MFVGQCNVYFYHGSLILTDTLNILLNENYTWHTSSFFDERKKNTWKKRGKSQFQWFTVRGYTCIFALVLNNYMGCIKWKQHLSHMWTVKVQMSLHIHTVLQLSQFIQAGGRWEPSIRELEPWLLNGLACTFKGWQAEILKGSFSLDTAYIWLWLWKEGKRLKHIFLQKIPEKIWKKWYFSTSSNCYTNIHFD